MIAIVLAAGFGTRLGPAGLNVPKGLLPVGNTNLLSLLVKNILDDCKPDKIVIVSNGRFYADFQRWVVGKPYREKLVLLNNGILSIKGRKGAVADLEYAVTSLSIREDVFVAASDCYLTFSLRAFADFFDQADECCVAVKPVQHLADLRDGAEVVIAGDNRIVQFVEKPRIPSSNLGAFPIYFLTRSSLGLLSEFRQEGMDPDSPGRFIEWLVKRSKVLAFSVNDGDCFDLGTPERYADIAATYARRHV